MACRNAQNAQQALEELKQETGKEALFLELDLSSLRSVRQAAEEFLKKENELHVLFNNG
jgi:retinol dehydrogenase 12